MEEIQNPHRRIAAKMAGDNEELLRGQIVWQLQTSGLGFASRPSFAVRSAASVRFRVNQKSENPSRPRRNWRGTGFF
jgi:hypothetical protein